MAVDDPPLTEQTLSPHYDAQQLAPAYYAWQEEQGLFRADPAAPGEPYAVMMPPPNVTGSLHMGHALNNTLQDILVRYKKMDGYNVLWMPGADHASIAVHWVLERALRAEKKSRHDLGREAFLERAWAFKESVQQTIVNQQRSLGIAADWGRYRFTMDEAYSGAVREAFVQLHQDGLIYRAERLVNWDPISQTSVSDLEVVYEDNVAAELYSFAYPLADGTGEIVVATTRPETMLGDSAVAVHPDDPRYAHLIGKKLQHPFVDAPHLKVIADAALVDPAFGTGAVKVTPAHSFDDFAVGQRHSLPMISILQPDGRLNDKAGEFAGLSVAQARQAVTLALAAKGLERGRTPHRLRLGRSERSGAVLEPRLSMQWFVRARPLRTPALAAVAHGTTRFFPQTWQNTYFAWMVDIRDWCISRQLWWGHRIPAWHCADCPHITVDKVTPEACGACGSGQLTQDEDILDTWFSSGLWPFSTLGWPKQTPELQRYYPTAVLITGFDIIFFWVARMMMLGQHLMGRPPFADVYIHALIRDASGEKMSKSKGNVVDPLEMVQTYGLDAFRFTLAAFAGQGRDVRWDPSRAAGYQKFVNKLWQAFRFMHANLLPEGEVPAIPALSIADRWILARLRQCTVSVRAALDTYRFSDAAAAIYAFVWDELCDWYLEISKTVFYASDAAAAAAATRQTLQQIFGALCRLLEPFMPFFAEAMWQRLPGGARPSVLLAAYPRPEEFPEDAAACAEFAFVSEIIGALRRLRAEYALAPRQPIEVLADLQTPGMQRLMPHAALCAGLARATLRPLTGKAPEQAAFLAVAGEQLWVPLADLVDPKAEGQRLQRELDKLASDLSKLTQQLGSPRFVERAPAAVVEEKRQLVAAGQQRQQELLAALKNLPVT
jgi:valyl-tRNA synthetase